MCNPLSFTVASVAIFVATLTHAGCQAKPDVERRLDLRHEFIYSIAVFPDNQHVAIGTGSGVLYVWNIDRNSLRRMQLTSTDSLLSGMITSLAVSADGNRILAGSTGGKLLVIDIDKEKILRVIQTEGQGLVESLLFLHDNRFFLSGNTASPDYAIQLWDMESGREVRRFVAKGAPDSIALSPNGKLFASTEFKSVALWNLETGHRVRTFSGHDSRVRALGFIGEGNNLISVSSGDICLWDIESGRCSQQMKGFPMLESARVASDSAQVFVGLSNAFLVVDVKNKHIVRRYTNLNGPTRGEFTTDRKYIIVGEQWGNVSVWARP